MDKAQVIASLAGDLNATEETVDAAIIRATALVQGMIGARTSLGLSPVAAAASQTKAMEAIAALSAARDAVVACHEELARDHRRLGWGVYNVGTLAKPDAQPTQRPTGQLRAV